MKILFVLLSTLMLSGCEDMGMLQHAVVVDKVKQEQMYMSCLDKIKVTHEASFAGMDSAIEKCNKIAVDYAIVNIEPIWSSQTKPPWISGSSDSYRLATPEQMQQIISNPKRPQPL